MSQAPGPARGSDPGLMHLDRVLHRGPSFLWFRTLSVDRCNKRPKRPTNSARHSESATPWQADESRGLTVEPITTSHPQARNLSSESLKLAISVGHTQLKSSG